MRPMPWLVFCLLILMCLLCSDRDRAQGPDGMREVLRGATFIFIGTVVKLNATTMPDAVKASESTVVVRVDKMMDDPGVPLDLAGREITVQLSRVGSVRAGRQAIFFTRGWLMGESIAAIEVAPPGEADHWPQVLELVQKTRQKIADEALQRELASAEVVVAGSVARVAPCGLPELPTEHTPLWQEAVIQVQHPALKGSVSGYTVTACFSSSEDPVWRTSPKFKERQRGIWLLHHKQMDLRGLESQLTALKALDFQSIDQLDRIKQFLKRAR